MTDVSTLQNIRFEASSVYLFLGSNLDLVVGPLLTARHEIPDNLPQTLLLSLRDPKEGQPECLAVHPLNVCRSNHERPFLVWPINATSQRGEFVYSLAVGAVLFMPCFNASYGVPLNQVVYLNIPGWTSISTQVILSAEIFSRRACSSRDSGLGASYSQ